VLFKSFSSYLFFIKIALTSSNSYLKTFTDLLSIQTAV
jgi:hypothetical protein